MKAAVTVSPHHARKRLSAALLALGICAATLDAAAHTDREEQKATAMRSAAEIRYRDGSACLALLDALSAANWGATRYVFGCLSTLSGYLARSSQ